MKKTPAQKAKETRERKLAAALEEMGEAPVKKKRKRRKPMTEEQRVAASERLKLARAARKPAKNMSVHESIRDLEDDHPLHPTKVKDWIKFHKKALKDMKSFKSSDDRQERHAYQTKENYIRNMETYLRSGTWLDVRWGNDQENPMYQVCYAMAYEDGLPKRTKGVYYPDMREIYTGEDDED